MQGIGKNEQYSHAMIMLCEGESIIVESLKIFFRIIISIVFYNECLYYFISNIKFNYIEECHDSNRSLHFRRR